MKTKSSMTSLFLISGIVLFIFSTSQDGMGSENENINKYKFPGSNVRVTGEINGVSFAEETKDAQPIDGNVKGVPFSMWVTGEKDNHLGQSKMIYSTSNKKEEVLSEPPIDRTRVLTSDEENNHEEASHEEGIFVSGKTQIKEVKKGALLNQEKKIDDEPLSSRTESVEDTGVLISK